MMERSQAEAAGGDIAWALATARELQSLYPNTATVRVARAFVEVNALESAAQELLMMASNYAKAGRLELMREACERILTRYPGTRASLQAKKMLAG